MNFNVKVFSQKRKSFLSKKSMLMSIASVMATVCALAVPSHSYATESDATQFPVLETTNETKVFRYKVKNRSKPRSVANIETYNRFTIGEIVVKQTPSQLSLRDLQANGVFFDIPSTPPVSIDEAADPVKDGILTRLGDVSTWVNIAFKVWNLIKDNAPVANVSNQTISVIPQGLQWFEMERWKGPSATSYTIEAKNLYGMTVVSQTYTVAFNYGGSLRGKGAFLANATIIPTKINVSWGFKLNSEVQVGQPVNTGAFDSPVPGVALTVKWQMNSILKHLEGRNQFFLRGDGTSDQVTVL